MSVAIAVRDEIWERLATDWPWWAEHCARIVNTSGKVVPFVPKPAQLRIWEAAKAQQDIGRPVRLLIPKARKEGVSTQAISMLVQRTTTRAHHNAISVAQDKKTSGELMALAEFIYNNLPNSTEFPVKPPIASRSRRSEIEFGTPSRVSREAGDMGLNSRLIVDTAREFEAGRGFTFHSVHGSECGFWPDLKRKLTSLINAVPDEPDTFVGLESTSNGHNWWRQLCMDALEGKNDFVLVFLAWFDEPQYARPFLSDEEKGEFIESIGQVEHSDEEPDLLTAGVSYEQLNWRRWAIANRCQGDLRTFHQEYPSSLEQSFLSTGRHVFDQELVARMIRDSEKNETPALGGFHALAHKTYRHRFGSVEVPEKPVWKPDPRGSWELWDQPDPEKQYILAVDPAGDDVMDGHERAMHAIVILEHRSRRQVAQMEWQGDADQVAVQAYLAALHYNRAWFAVETTGGWGTSIARRVFREYKYPFVYKRTRIEAGMETQEERLGFDTNRVTKVILEDGAKEMLREGTHGIRSPKMARQFTTYMRDVGRKSGPAPGTRSDLLMAWMIAQQVAQEVPIRRGDGQGGVISTTTRAVLNTKTGW